MKERYLYTRLILLFIFFFPIVIYTCGGEGGGGSAVTSVSGRVTTSNGTGLQGAIVNLSGADGTGAGCTPASMSTMTDANGYYIFSSSDSGLTSGTGTITASMSGYTLLPSSRTVTINYGDAITGQDFIATPFFTISGKITTASGQAIAGVPVALSGDKVSSTATGSDGRYAFTVVYAGSYTITPSGYVFSPSSITVAVVDADISGKDFVAETLVISGWVTSAGTGVSGITINLQGPSSSASAVSDNSGYYSFSGLLDGSYTLTPSTTCLVTPASITSVINGADLSGQNFTVDLPDQSPHNISGMVTKASDGTGLPDVNISIRYPDGNFTGVATSTDATGYYSTLHFSGYGGVYDVRPTLSGYTFVPDFRRVIMCSDLTGVDFTAQ